MYCWHKGLPHEPKCTDAYIMLKQQGIVKDDPKYMDEVRMITTLCYVCKYKVISVSRNIFEYNIKGCSSLYQCINSLKTHMLNAGRFFL